MTSLLAVILVAGCCTVTDGQELEITITNIKTSEGSLMVGLFSTEATFMKNPLRGEKPKAKSGTVVVTFRDIPPGEYAISVFHDANENGKLDSNSIGIPTEGVGFSNDAMGMFGPPSFEKATFKFPSRNKLSVTIKYF